MVSIYRHFKRTDDNNIYVFSWKPKGLSDEAIETPTSPNNFLSPLVLYAGNSASVKFNGSCLRQDVIRLLHGKIVKMYIVYEIIKNNPISSYSTLEICLFGAVRLTKNTDIDKYKYSGYGIGFDRKISKYRSKSC